MKNKISRKKYVRMYGPTVGDKIRLGDTNLWIQIEQDLLTYGDENVFGGGKTIRDGMGQHPTATRYEGVLDLVITNAVIIDTWGIIKADIGIKDGMIVNIGKAGNPYTMDNVTPNMYIGVGTDVISAENKIITAGCIDSHVHYICPQSLKFALSCGTTTVIGGGIGPTTGSLATNCTSGVWNIQKMIQATDNIPINVIVLGRGNSSNPRALIEQIEAGSGALKIHEDWGSTPYVINNCLEVADQFDIQINIHTDSLNESGYVEDTIKIIKDRTIHAYHIEGAGGGHTPDLLRMVSFSNILPSSTTPTLPYGSNTIDEHIKMLMVCHHLDPKMDEDISFAKSRIRNNTISAEGVLHDIGAISMISSDSQAMGRIGEIIRRTWQTADKMKKERGFLKEDAVLKCDNFRVKRYIAKYTINPAITHGISHLVGSIQPGKVADLVMWKPSFFGTKPEMTIKNGFIVFSTMGDINASIASPQPYMYRPMFGYSVSELGILFVSKASLNHITSLGIKKTIKVVKNCRTICKKDLQLNYATPEIYIDNKTHEVFINQEKVLSFPSIKLPLTQKYFLF